MITLYRFSSSPFSDKVVRAMNYKSLPFQVHEVNRLKARRGKYAHVSSTGKFPALEIDGRAVHDSTDIIERLEELQPEPRLIPQDPYLRAQAHVIEEWADESLYFYEMLMRAGWEHNLDSSFAEIKATAPPLPDKMLRRMVVKSINKLVNTQGVGRKPRDQVIADAQRHVDAVDAFLTQGDWLVGDALSVADLAVIAQFKKLMYASEFAEIMQSAPRVQDWMARVNSVASGTVRAA